MFLDAGGTLLDTAASYGAGETERLIGTLLGSVVDRERPGARHQGRHHAPRRRRARRRRVPARAPRQPRHVPAADSASTTSTSGRCTPGRTTRHSRRPFPRWTSRSRPVGPGTSASRTTPAGRRPAPRRTSRRRRAGPPSRRPRSSTRSSSAGSSARSCPRPSPSASASCRGDPWAAECSPASTAPACRRTRVRRPRSSSGTSEST